jgi:hypothetical protein
MAMLKTNVIIESLFASAFAGLQDRLYPLGYVDHHVDRTTAPRRPRCPAPPVFVTQSPVSTAVSVTSCVVV